MSDETEGAIVNPIVYLNYFPPDEVKQFEAARNLYIFELGLVAGDILSFIPEDIRIIKRCNGLFTTICFASVRFLALIYLGLLVAMFTIPIPNCRPVQVASGIFCLLTMAATSFLFLRRVQAVYSGNRLVYWSFAVLWAATSSLVILFIPGTSSEAVPGAGYCGVYKTEIYVPISNFMPPLFDTLVFFAISYKIAFQYNRLPGRKFGWARSWFSTSTLPVFSKAILKGGQQYYLATLCLCVLSAGISFSPIIPPTHRVLTSISATSLAACLACRAHRIMVDAYYHEDEEAPAISNIQFASSPPHTSVSQPVSKGGSTLVEPKRLSIASERS